MSAIGSHRRLRSTLTCVLATSASAARTLSGLEFDSEPVITAYDQAGSRKLRSQAPEERLFGRADAGQNEIGIFDAGRY
jgi:hypothetical protein